MILLIKNREIIIYKYKLVNSFFINNYMFYVLDMKR